jgi:hypothetical protein
MTTFQFQTHVSDSGVITLPTLAETFYGEDVTVKVDMDRQTMEQRKAAGQMFFDTWNGLLEGMPDMTAQEIRAERLERRYTRQKNF